MLKVSRIKVKSDGLATTKVSLTYSGRKTFESISLRTISLKKGVLVQQSSISFLRVLFVKEVLIRFLL